MSEREEYVKVPVGLFTIEGEGRGSYLPLLYCAFQLDKIKYDGHYRFHIVSYESFCFHMGYKVSERKKNRRAFQKDMEAFDKFNKLFNLEMTKKEYMNGKHKDMHLVYDMPYDYYLEATKDNKEYTAFIRQKTLIELFRSKESLSTKSKLLECLVRIHKATKKRKEEDKSESAKRAIEERIPEVYPAMSCNLAHVFKVSRKTVDSLIEKMVNLKLLNMDTYKYNIFNKGKLFRQVNIHLITIRDFVNHSETKELKNGKNWLVKNIAEYNRNHRFKEISLSRIFDPIGVKEGTKYRFIKAK